MMAEFKLDLRSAVSIRPDFAEQNITGLGDGWKIAEEMARLHSIAIQRIARAAGPHPSQQDLGTVLLGTHGLNLFLEFMGLVIRGRFDVASYLPRAILDCQSLAFAVQSDAGLAAQFFDGKLRGYQGRVKVVEAIRPVEAELADYLERRFKDEAGAANDLSHVNLTHLEKLVDRDGDSVTPIVGGRVDHDLGRSLTGSALENEDWHLSWFEAFHGSTVGQDWVNERSAMKNSFRAWMKEVFGATGYNADTDSWDETASN